MRELPQTFPMYRKQNAWKDGDKTYMGRRTGPMWRYQIYDWKQGDLWKEKGDHRTRIWDGKRTTRFSLYPICGKSPNGTKNWAHFCMHELEKVSKDPGKQRGKRSPCAKRSLTLGSENWNDTSKQKMVLEQGLNTIFVYSLNRVSEIPTPCFYP